MTHRDAKVLKKLLDGLRKLAKADGMQIPNAATPLKVKSLLVTTGTRDYPVPAQKPKKSFRIKVSRQKAISGDTGKGNKALIEPNETSGEDRHENFQAQGVVIEGTGGTQTEDASARNT